jgi:hypothetical protein
VAEKLINDVGNARVKAHKPPKDEFKVKGESSKPVDTVVKAVKAPVVQAPPVTAVKRWWSRGSSSSHSMATRRALEALKTLLSGAV